MLKEQYSEDTLFDLAELFKVFGDSSRIKILFSLLETEAAVTSISEKLNMTQSAVSHQLKLLRMAHQVKARREGKSIYYSLDDQHVIDILDEALIHIRHKMKETE